MGVPQGQPAPLQGGVPQPEGPHLQGQGEREFFGGIHFKESGYSQLKIGAPIIKDWGRVLLIKNRGTQKRKVGSVNYLVLDFLSLFFLRETNCWRTLFSSPSIPFSPPPITFSQGKKSQNRFFFSLAPSQERVFPFPTENF